MNKSAKTVGAVHTHTHTHTICLQNERIGGQSGERAVI